MSGLAAVLAERHAPGVYRWHGNFHAADVRHTVQHAGWTYGHLDGWEIEHKAEFLSSIGEALSFPDHYGQNLDALADCLSDLPMHATTTPRRWWCCSAARARTCPRSARSTDRSRSPLRGEVTGDAGRSQGS